MTNMLDVLPDNPDYIQAQSQMQLYGGLLFSSISGSHLYGFPGCNPDLDIRGVYIAPSEHILGLSDPKASDNFVFMGKSRYIDIAYDEVEKYLSLLYKGNVSRLDWANSDLEVTQTDAGKRLKKFVLEELVTSKMWDHYYYFAENMWDQGNRENQKYLLYALRIYMTGIQLFENGKLCSNIHTLNDHFGYDIIHELAENHRLGTEFNSIPEHMKQIQLVLTELKKRMESTKLKSCLKDEPDFRKVNNFLINLRKEFYD